MKKQLVFGKTRHAFLQKGVDTVLKVGSLTGLPLEVGFESELSLSVEVVVERGIACFFAQT